MAQVLSLTPAAIERVRHLVETVGEGAAGIRIGVRTAGCSGLSYTMDFAREIAPHEDVIEADGVRIVVDPKAAMYRASSSATRTRPGAAAAANRSPSDALPRMPCHA
jgi:iron-sulfur cluster assembly accessory protein